MPPTEPPATSAVVTDAWSRALDWALSAIVHELANVASGLTLLTEDIPDLTAEERMEIGERAASASVVLGALIDDARAILATEPQSQSDVATAIARADRVVRSATRRSVVLTIELRDAVVVRGSSRALSRALIVAIHGLVAATPRGGPRPPLHVDVETHGKVAHVVLRVAGLPAAGAEAAALGAAALVEGAVGHCEREGDRTTIRLELARP